VLPMCREGDRQAADALAAEGYRVLALAEGRFEPGSRAADIQRPTGLTLLGFVGLLDPIRPQVPEAIARCTEAGISVRMITGDHPQTALTISRTLGFATRQEDVVTGAILASAPDDAGRRALIAGARVFARVEPTQKLEIVQALQADGHWVAVTGDGVNDAPALAAAQIGVAMGRGGTDVARGAADLILTDDNFASIVGGVEEGRIAYGNIRRIVTVLLATGAAEILLFVGALVLGLPMPLTAVQLLWLNLVTNGVQDVTLGFGRGEGDELRQKPRSPKEPILDGKAIALIIPAALTMSGLVLLLFAEAIGAGANVEVAQNLALFTMVIFQNFYVLSLRSERRPVWRISFAANPWVIAGIIGALALHLGAMHWAPFQRVLGTAPLASSSYLAPIGAAVGLMVMSEGIKSLLRRKSVQR